MESTKRAPAALMFCIVLGLAPAATAFAADIATAPVARAASDGVYVSDGTVEAVRQSVIAPQVAGRITDLRVKAGDTVKAGQILARIDERAAEQQASASQAQVAAAQAQLDAARREFARSERLFSKKYISQTAMDQAEAQFKATEAQVRSLLAQAGLASTQTSFHTIQAPYSGIVAEVSCELGDMATPGKPLFRIYDPAALRVVSDVPESVARSIATAGPAKIELPAVAEAMRWQSAVAVTVLPTADPASHTMQLRLALPPRIAGIAPGMFARTHLPLTDAASGSAPSSKRLTIPSASVIRRTELDAVYVVDGKGARLRQVRLGRVLADRVEVLAGLSEGERVALDPIAAARIQP